MQNANDRTFHRVLSVCVLSAFLHIIIFQHILPVLTHLVSFQIGYRQLFFSHWFRTDLILRQNVENLNLLLFFPLFFLTYKCIESIKSSLGKKWIWIWNPSLIYNYWFFSKNYLFIFFFSFSSDQFQVERVNCASVASLKMSCIDVVHEHFHGYAVLCCGNLLS